MKKLFIGFTLLMFMNIAGATLIQSSSDCPSNAGCDPSFTDSYGFTMSIESTDDLLWSLTLENDGANGLIDLFAMDMGAVLGTDFTVANFDPTSWSFYSTSGGIQFDYVGASGSPADRLGVGDSLTFDFIFNEATDYTVWTDAAASLGTGIGGGTDLGQIAVSFQSLGLDGEYSDLIGDSWQTVVIPDPVGVPEPTPLALMGLGLIGIGMVKRKQRVG